MLRVLREAKGPLTTVEVAQQFIADRGVDGADSRAVRLVTKRVRKAFGHQRVKGPVRMVAGPGTVGV